MDKNKTIRIALTKGRLEKAAVEIFENIGLDCSELKDKGRKLIFHDFKNSIDFVLVKAPDVLTYVEHGAADIGIVGKDTLLEMKKDFYEVLDLKVGKCKFSLASISSFKLNEGFNRMKIATKYPNVTREYFREKGIDVEIIKIEGSVELAPILNLADAIVDIVETGTTLKENGLVIFDDICDISARMIVNRASMKLNKDRITDIIQKVKNYVERES
ncbi:ATP phosphoribosyltransferase [Clostridium acetobutylicum]|uniref:ATP phosphoribosyltransferase n=2 Tax=Bacteria TaxID=2 RepID=HIS1_CLOAB|nr:MULTISPECIES: ATP phosphoribosyltransferase [Clostridium]Q97KI3.1 RecName: Full=ATP phosphoribosyltransferase; Short=ATP-PRT; Short=ATP-PRTase [Clostridium acetobutylicum ATCC 824]AAK78912.1 ATP phosphoribosyltransferase [Clostridium acetobutylicum ATCC 824]ADZ19987.1 ATP phosphoribosyltransferase catalytic subunit [Clostridium acetobutylicum EA 2018]AEI33838.1 ATP phosphoribosyltransferase catalytic subunit [Clostridium acetobutylicum DSM 1731]AWV80631.1 ATP phosphoribosyltransferase [Clos